MFPDFQLLQFFLAFQWASCDQNTICRSSWQWPTQRGLVSPGLEEWEVISEALKILRGSDRAGVTMGLWVLVQLGTPPLPRPCNSILTDLPPTTSVVENSTGSSTSQGDEISPHPHPNWFILGLCGFSPGAPISSHSPKHANCWKTGCRWLAGPSVGVDGHVKENRFQGNQWGKWDWWEPADAHEPYDLLNFNKTRQIEPAISNRWLHLEFTAYYNAAEMAYISHDG